MLANQKSLLFIFILSAILTGCSGSPVHTSKLSPEKLTQESDYTICHGAASTKHFKPHLNVINEAKRRQLDCSLVYTTPLPRRSNIDRAIHSKKLDRTWVWCKDSTGCVKAVNWMKKNNKWGKDSEITKSYQLTLEKAINFHDSNMVSIIGNGVTKSKKLHKLELKSGVFTTTELTKKEAKILNINNNSVSHELPAPAQEKKY